MNRTIDVGITTTLTPSISCIINKNAITNRFDLLHTRKIDSYKAWNEKSVMSELVSFISELRPLEMLKYSLKKPMSEDIDINSV